MDNEQYLDLMASVALQGLLAGPETSGLGWDNIAECAYYMADKMWEEREKRRAALEKK